MQYFEDIVNRYDLVCMEMIIVILLLLGGWPLVRDEQNTWFKSIRFLKYTTLFSCFIHFLIEAYNVTTKLADYERLSESLMHIINLIKCTIRLATCVFRNNILVDLVTRLDTFATDLTKDEQLIFLQHKRRAQLFTFFSCLLSFLLVAVYVIVPLFESERQFPGHVQFPFYALDTPVYEVVYILCALIGPAEATINALGDSFLVTALTHVTSYLHILQFRLEHSYEYAQKDILENCQVVSNILQTNDGATDAIEPIQVHDTVVITVCNNVENTIVVESHYEIDTTPDADGLNMTSLEESTKDRPQTGDMEPQFSQSASTEVKKMDQTGKVMGGASNAIEPIQVHDSVVITVCNNVENTIVVESHYEIDTTPDADGLNMTSLEESTKDRPKTGDMEPQFSQSASTEVNKLDKTEKVEGGTDEEKEQQQPKEKSLDLAMVEHLGRCVAFHVKLIGFVDYLQTTQSVLLIFELSVGSTVTCIALFQTTAAVSSDGLGFSVKLVVWLTCLVIIILQLFVIFWTCSEVADESRNVSDAMYFSDWLDTPLAYKRSMLIIMSRALDPIQLRAASFLPFTMEFFTNMMNSGYSYFNMVTQMQKKK